MQYLRKSSFNSRLDQLGVILEVIDLKRFCIDFTRTGKIVDRTSA